MLGFVLAAAVLLFGVTGVDPWDRCGECHGLDGAGNRIKFPRIAGQKESYIIKQLYDFRAGRRKNDGGQMQQTATEVAAADIGRVAEWFAIQTPSWPKSRSMRNRTLPARGNWPFRSAPAFQPVCHAIPRHL
jgi:cytochrome c553